MEDLSHCTFVICYVFCVTLCANVRTVMALCFVLQTMLFLPSPATPALSSSSLWFMNTTQL